MWANQTWRRASAHKHILLIEDNPDGRESLRMLLSLLGHHVDVAADGIEGVRKALNSRPDVALIDLGLPRLNGYEVARRLRATLGPKVVLLAYTAYDDEKTAWRVAEAGFNAHLVKPVNLSELTPWLDDEHLLSNGSCGAGGVMKPT